MRKHLLPITFDSSLITLAGLLPFPHSPGSLFIHHLFLRTSHSGLYLRSHLRLKTPEVVKAEPISGDLNAFRVDERLPFGVQIVKGPFDLGMKPAIHLDG